MLQIANGIPIEDGIDERVRIFSMLRGRKENEMTKTGKTRTAAAVVYI